MERLRKACEGKSQAEGGMNLPEIRAVAVSLGHSGIGDRETLVKVICEGHEALVGPEGQGSSVTQDLPRSLQRYSSQGILMDEAELDKLKHAVMTPTPQELKAGQKERVQLKAELAKVQGQVQGQVQIQDQHSNLAAISLLDSLDRSTLRFVMDQMDYPTLISLSKTNKELHALVQARFDGQAEHAIAKLKLPSDTNKSELIEKLYHMNNYQNASLKDITISNRGYNVWIKKGYIIISHDGIRQTWRTPNGISRLMGPAFQEWRNGIKTLEEWYLNGQFHRTDGPACQAWNPNGFKTKTQWYYQGQLHRTNGPAQELRDDKRHSYSWYIEGRLHRVDGPAEIIMSMTEKHNYYTERWYKWGKIHRLDGPAMYENTTDIGETFTWYKEGMIHRDLAPAVYENDINTDGDAVVDVIWYNHGKRHRLTGPAHLRWVDGIFGREYWLKEGIYDRSDGAAIIKWFRDGTKQMEYLRNNMPITEQQLSDNLGDF